MHVHIRSVIAIKYGGEVADGIPILYGVVPANLQMPQDIFSPMLMVV